MKEQAPSRYKVTHVAHKSSSLSPPLGELRLDFPGPSYLIGADANASNTVEPGSVCEPVSVGNDSIKEGNRLSLLRLNSSETVVMIGGRQALFIETANDG